MIKFLLGFIALIFIGLTVYVSTDKESSPPKKSTTAETKIEIDSLEEVSMQDVSAKKPSAKKPSAKKQKKIIVSDISKESHKDGLSKKIDLDISLLKDIDNSVEDEGDIDTKEISFENLKEVEEVLLSSEEDNNEEINISEDEISIIK